VPGDSHDQRGEEERGDDAFDQPKEYGRQDLQRRRVECRYVSAVGKEISEGHAHDHGDDNPPRSSSHQQCRNRESTQPYRIGRGSRIGLDLMPVSGSVLQTSDDDPDVDFAGSGSTNSGFWFDE
jgi:hypothetical protein